VELFIISINQKLTSAGFAVLHLKKKMMMELDEWQKKVLETEGNICLRSGRQVGKTTIISRKASEYAIKNKDKTILVIASVERQAYHLFEMILDYL
jgi:predicted AAA+ superfamily ATPase